MTLLVLDSGGVTDLSIQRIASVEKISTFRADGLWPPVVPTVVLVECLSGRQHTDATVNRFLKACDIVDELPEPVARRAGILRDRAGRGSAVDAVVIAMAEPDGTVLNGDIKDLKALATHARGVQVHHT
ncbi:MAG: hypothetical protein OXI96_06355 [Acidimicrobiaceae bacterium]|nr:hypothetical protein [Acidimicrobiaceae bacterium]